MKADQGSRTDMMFTSLCAVRQVDIGRDWPDDEDCDDYECGVDIEVSGHGEEICYTGDACHGIKAMVFRSWHADSCGGGRAKEWIDLAARRSSFGLGFSAARVSEAIHYLEREGGPFCCDPTTGAHAVLTMALACETVVLYGFAGIGTIDGHHETLGTDHDGHGVNAEHRLYHALQAHKLPEADVTPALWPLLPFVNLRYEEEINGG